MSALDGVSGFDPGDERRGADDFAVDGDVDAGLELAQDLAGGVRWLPVREGELVDLAAAFVTEPVGADDDARRADDFDGAIRRGHANARALGHREPRDRRAHQRRRGFAAGHVALDQVRHHRAAPRLVLRGGAAKRGGRRSARAVAAAPPLRRDHRRGRHRDRGHRDAPSARARAPPAGVARREIVERRRHRVEDALAREVVERVAGGGANRARHGTETVDDRRARLAARAV
jgi:hypothetical protein